MYVRVYVGYIMVVRLPGKDCHPYGRKKIKLLLYLGGEKGGEGGRVGGTRK